MPVTLSPFAGAGWQFFDSNGNPLGGGLIYTYAAGTSTPLATFTTFNGNIQNSNPIQLDAAGRLPEEMWLTVGYGYKFVVKDANNVLIRTYDNIPSNAPSPFANDASSVAYEQGNEVTAGNFIVGISYQITELGNTDFVAIGATSNTLNTYFTATGIGSGTGKAKTSHSVQSKLQEQVSVKDFGAFGNGVADDTDAIQAAFDSGAKSVYFPSGTYNFTQLFVRANNVEIYGAGTGSVLNSTDTSVFCAIAFVENYTNIYFHDLKVQGCASSEVAQIYRGIVNGTNTSGTNHTTLVWDAFNRIEKVTITGAIPGTNGFNVCCQFNKANYSTFQNNVVESIYGTNDGYGHGIVCNGKGQQVLYSRFISTISGQGRHAIYVTSEPVATKVIGNYCEGFQNNGISSNTSAAGGYDVLIEGNTVYNCLLTGTGTTAAAIIINGIFGAKVINNTIRGSVYGSNKNGITISVADSGSVSDDAIVDGNYIAGPIETGILVVNAQNVRVTNNVILNPDAALTNTFGGIDIQQSNYGLYQGNFIQGTGGASTYRYGIRINVTPTISNNNMIYDNQILGSPYLDYENDTTVPSNVYRLPQNGPKTIGFTPKTGDQTIDVSQNARVVIGIYPSTGTLNITNLTGGYQGQMVTLLIVGNNVVIKHGNFYTSTSADLSPTYFSTATFVFWGTIWYQVSYYSGLG